MSNYELLIIGIASVVIFFIALYLTLRISKFKEELDFINEEICRTVGRERKHWQREKRRLWLSLIPFYRR